MRSQSGQLMKGVRLRPDAYAISDLNGSLRAYGWLEASGRLSVVGERMVIKRSYAIYFIYWSMLQFV